MIGLKIIELDSTQSGADSNTAANDLTCFGAINYVAGPIGIEPSAYDCSRSNSHSAAWNAEYFKSAEGYISAD